MFGFGKNARKNHLIKRYKESFDYVSSGAHLNDSSNYDHYGHQASLIKSILEEFGINVNDDINNQKSKLISMFDYLVSFNNRVPKYGVKFDVSVAIGMQSRTFNSNSDDEVNAVLSETCPEYGEISRPIL